MLRYHAIITVEKLAGLADHEVRSAMGGTLYRDRARQFLAMHGKPSAPASAELAPSTGAAARSAVAAPAVQPALAAAAPVEGPGLAGRWLGTYNCSGMSMSVELVLQDVDEEVLWGRYSYWLTGAPRAEDGGSYYIYGIKYRNTKQIKLVGTRWIKRPNGHTQINVDALYTASGMKGKTSLATCTGFEITRVALAADGLGVIPKEISATMGYAKTQAARGRPPKLDVP